MIQLPANLAQRILDAARIATAIHQEQLSSQYSTNPSAGGAGLTVVDHDGSFSMDVSATPHRHSGARVR